MPIIGDASPRTEGPGSGALAVETSGLTKAFGRRVVVDDLTLRVPKAAVAAFVGPNGSGKSTTLRMLLGLLRPTSGTGWVLGGDISRPETYLPRVGSLIEGPAFYPGLSGRGNLEVLKVLGGLKQDRIAEVLRLVGLEKRADDRVSKYSLGMKQRLGVAAALLPGPQLLVLDEPTNGLDPTGIASMRVLLSQIAGAGISVLVSSHQLSELQQVADWVIMISGGRLRYQGKLDLLLERRTNTFVSPENAGDIGRLADLLREKGYAPEPAGPARLMLKLTHGSASQLNRMAMEAGIVLSELQSGQSTLEDVYFDMTDGGSIA
jgi:ABC-2 type transport system ATP-binding protein